MASYSHIIETAPGDIWRGATFGTTLLVGIGDTVFVGCRFRSVYNEAMGTITFHNCKIGKHLVKNLMVHVNRRTE